MSLSSSSQNARTSDPSPSGGLRRTRRGCSVPTEVDEPFYISHGRHGNNLCSSQNLQSHALLPTAEYFYVVSFPSARLRKLARRSRINHPGEVIHARVRIDHSSFGINVRLCRRKVCGEIRGMRSRMIGDASAVTKWHQVHTRAGEARGQIDPFPEMNYL